VSLNKSQNAAVHTLASATDQSALILVKLHAQKDTLDTLLTLTVVAQLLDAAQSLLHQSQPQLPTPEHILLDQPSHQHHISPPLPQQRQLQSLQLKSASALTKAVTIDITVRSGQLPTARAAAVLLQALSNAQLKNALKANLALMMNTSQLNTTSVHAARPYAALQSNAEIHVRRSSVRRLRSQHVLLTKTASHESSIQTAAATITTVNATRTSATTSKRPHAQPVSTDKLLKLMPVVQLLDVVKPLQPLPPSLLHTQQPQSLTQFQQHTLLPQQSVFVLTEKVANVNMVNLGHTKKNHA
jgi:hypothetical protein